MFKNRFGGLMVDARDIDHTAIRLEWRIVDAKDGMIDSGHVSLKDLKKKQLG